MIEQVCVSGLAPAALIARVARALEGGAPIAPYAADRPRLPDHDPHDLPEGLALVVATSGSTHTPKHALLTGSALRASAVATHTALGGPGRWVLALPSAHIAGMQVLIRSVCAGTTPIPIPRTGPFGAADLAAAVEQAPGERLYTALVPTQVARLLTDPDGVRALRRFAAVLVGGAALPPPLRAAAVAAQVRLVATYGMSESAGGCVYDGVPLTGARVRLADDGRISLGGDTLAHGYLGRAAPEFSVTDGVRWFATDDLGELLPDGRLHVQGRLDDVIVTGAMKVHPRVVEDAVLGAFPNARAAVAVGVPDAEWGQAIALTLVLDPATARPPLTELRARLRGELAAYALPRRVRYVPALPERGPGKPDRAAIAAAFADTTGTVGGGEVGQ